MEKNQMDSDHFYALTRELSSRRTTLAGLVGGGFTALTGLLDAGGLDARKRRRKKRKKKSKSQPLPPDPPPPPTCTDGLKNGDETDVDCGGSCPRCAIGRACTGNNDCLGALCIASTCQACTSDDQCNDVAKELCTCRTTVNNQQICKPATTPVQVGSCDACPPDTNCFPGFDLDECFRPCGAG
jgi:hypothetical protein